MSNTCAATMKTTTSVNYEKKVSLFERFKKYLLENNEIICAGVITMNGGTYIPTNLRNRQCEKYGMHRN